MLNTRPRIIVLITCHNRRELTVSAVKALETANDGASDLSVLLADAGSNDGTIEAVQALNVSVEILRLGADVYWNAGMREAWLHAARLHPPADFYLWLNDDLALNPGSLKGLLSEYAYEAELSGPRVIVVGRTVDPDSGQTSYGGYVRASWRSPVSWRHPKGTERYCETMNGNCVLLPARAVDEIGVLSDKFRHAFGDIDYGLMARKSGYVIVQCSDPAGVQKANLDQLYTGARSGISAKAIQHALTHPKALPFSEMLYFYRKHAGPLWPARLALRYAKLFGAV